MFDEHRKVAAGSDDGPSDARCLGDGVGAPFASPDAAAGEVNESGSTEALSSSAESPSSAGGLVEVVAENLHAEQDSPDVAAVGAEVDPAGAGGTQGPAPHPPDRRGCPRTWSELRALSRAQAGELSRLQAEQDAAERDAAEKDAAERDADRDATERDAERAATERDVERDATERDAERAATERAAAELVAGERAAAEVEAVGVEVSGAALVARIVELSGWIAGLEAARLEAVYALHEHPSMLALPAAVRSGKGRVRDLSAFDLTHAEVTARLRLGVMDGARLVETSLNLVQRLPRTLQALRRGQVDLKRAALIGEHAAKLAEDHYRMARTQGLCPEQAERRAVQVAGQVEDVVLAQAPDLAPAQLIDALTRAVIVIDPEHAERHRKDEQRCRSVRHRTNRGTGTGDLFAHLSAVDAQAIYTTIDGYARLARQQGDRRTLDELRADALTDAFFNPPSTPPTSTPPGSTPQVSAPQVSAPQVSAPQVSAPQVSAPQVSAPQVSAPQVSAAQVSGPAGSAAQVSAPPAAGGCTVIAHQDHGKPPHRTTGQDPPVRKQVTPRPSSAQRVQIHVTIDLATLLNLNQHPGELTGHGPITAAYARALAHQPGTTWRRLISDPITGQLLHLGRTTYRPPTALQEHVRARDVTCTHPGCTRPAHHSDLDHLIPYPAGTTDETNLHAHCRHHHRLKHEGRWNHQRSTNPTHPPGTILIISPTGQTYLNHPPPLTHPHPHPTHTPTPDTPLPHHTKPDTTHHNRNRDRDSDSDLTLLDAVKRSDPAALPDAAVPSSAGAGSPVAHPARTTKEFLDQLFPADLGKPRDGGASQPDESPPVTGNSRGSQSRSWGGNSSGAGNSRGEDDPVPF